MYNLNLSQDEEFKAKWIYEDSNVIDGCVPWGTLDQKDLNAAQKHIDGGITACNFTVAHFPHNFERAVLRIIKYKKIINDNPDKFMLVNEVSDINKAKKEKKLGIILGFQDTAPIEDNLDFLNVFYDLGVRIVQLTYNTQNLVGSGCCELSYGPLTIFGRRVVQRMNELGITIDLSHCSDETTIDAIKLSKQPVLITHSSVRSICNCYGRNKIDDQIKTLAEKGGVIGICLAPAFIKRDNKTFEVLPSKLEDTIDHIEYVIDLVGIDHVGFGSDICETWLDQKQTPPESSWRNWRPVRPDIFGKGPTETYDLPTEGVEDHTQFNNLARGLIKRGYGESEIKKVLGENFARVLNKTWSKSC
jgi:membrane dipeptidase